MCGDNQSVVNTGSVPQGKLHKRHNALSYHKTREAVAAGITRFYHIDGKVNPADIMSKHWDYPSIWESLRPILFWEGDTADLLTIVHKRKDFRQPSATEGSASVSIPLVSESRSKQSRKGNVASKGPSQSNESDPDLTSTKTQFGTRAEKSSSET